jgi:hypothetical protein
MTTQYAIVTTEGETLTGPEWERLIDRLAREIRWHEQQAQANARTALTHKVEIGLRLIRAKELLDHGEFLPWGKQEFGWQPKHLERHMALAAAWTANSSRVTNFAPDVSWRRINKALKGDGSDAPAEGGDALEDEPDALFWGARDGLLALRDAAQAQANRFGLKVHPENLTLTQLRELMARVRAATAAVTRVRAALDGVRAGRLAPRRGANDGSAPLGPQHRAILEALGDGRALTSKEMAPLTDIPVYVLSSRLSELAGRGLIARTGQKRGGAFEYMLADPQAVTVSPAGIER